jgi:hypothetical protein
VTFLSQLNSNGVSNVRDLILLYEDAPRLESFHSGISETDFEKFMEVKSLTTEKSKQTEPTPCPHSESEVSEGEWWGGASGSSSVEMLRLCKACGAQLDRWFVHND